MDCVGPKGISGPLGHICALDHCYGLGCPGTHYLYYQDIRDGYVSMTLNGEIVYIDPDGFTIYRQRTSDQSNAESSLDQHQLKRRRNC
jgi:hypothetical protein